MRQDIKNNKMGELTDDCRLLVISHMPLAYAMAWKMKNRGVSLGDLKQEGCIGLCEAAMRYDENADCSFAAFASQWCRKMMLLAIKRHKTSDNPQDDNIREPDDSDDLLRIGQQERIDEALECLSRQEQKVIRMFYGIDGNQLNLTEIANTLGISVKRASVVHKCALGKLEAALMERPLVDYLASWLK
jgi:RNA polymerase sigma factor (sigma-70 family)